MIRLKITGMTCEHCAVTVRSALENVEGVVKAEVRFPEGLAEVQTQGEVSPGDLVSAIERAGYGAEVLEEGPVVYIPSEDLPDLLIVGAASAGFASGIRAWDLGARRIIIVERGIIGGTCLNRGCVPSKFFIEASNLIHSSERDFPGLLPSRREINFMELVEAKKALLNELRKEKYLDVLSAYPGIEYIEAEGRFEGEDLLVAGDRSIRFSRCVIAVGSRPSLPPVEGIEEVPYITSDTVFDLEELPQKLLVLGGGAIGLELGQAFLRFGSEVTLIEAMPSLLPGADPLFGTKLEALLRDEGMRIFTGTRVERAQVRGGMIVLGLRRGDETFEVEGTHLLVATGRVPNTDSLFLDKAGVETDSRGFIRVSDSLQTTNPRIFSAGDCINRSLLVTLAAKEGAVAAENALIGSNKTIDYDSVPQAVFTDPEVAWVGISLEEAHKRGIEAEERTLDLSKVPRAVISGRTEGFFKVVAQKGRGRVLGVFVMAPHGAEVIHRAVSLVKHRLSLEDLLDLVDVYPTISEGVKLCAIGFERDVSRLSCCAQ